VTGTMVAGGNGTTGIIYGSALLRRRPDSLYSCADYKFITGKFN